MVNHCNHLTVTQKLELTNLFRKYKYLFSGKLGKVPGLPVELTLKRDVKPFYSVLYYTTGVYENSKKKNRRACRY